MTQEEIKKKALEAYPQEEYFDTASKNYYDDNEEKREGYIKALTDLNLDAIRGEAMHEIADRYEALPKIKGWMARDNDNCLTFFTNKPQWHIDHWVLLYQDDCIISIDDSLYPEVSQGNIIEVELIIRKV